jgi:hypothetical protein
MVNVCKWFTVVTQEKKTLLNCVVAFVLEILVLTRREQCIYVVMFDIFKLVLYKFGED